MRAGVVPARLAGVPHFGHSPPFSVDLEVPRPWWVHAESAVTTDPSSHFEEFGRQSEIGASERDAGFPRVVARMVVPAEPVQQGEVGEAGCGRAPKVFDDAEAGMPRRKGETRG